MKDHLVRPTLSRHACQQTRQLWCATFNVHSLANKVDVISQCWQDAGLDVLGLTETWQEDADNVSLRRLCSAGLQMLERARPVRQGARTNNVFYQNHGGVAVVASHSSISSPGERSLEVRSSSLSSTVRSLLQLWQHSSTSSAYCSNPFHRSVRPMSSLAILTYASTVRAIRRRYLRATELLDAFGTVQCVAGVTQDHGGTLGVVISRVEDRPSTVDIVTAPGGASDHRLVAWPFHAAQVETPVYRTQ